MQTFLPYASFLATASVLDSRRLNKQITETWQILNAIENGGAWQNHPAVQMWTEYKDCLIVYGIILYSEWQRRYQDGKRGGKLEHKAGEKLRSRYSYEYPHKPPWLGDERLHKTHRACLLAKNYEHYSQFGWTEKPTSKTKDGWPYWWPTNTNT